MNYCKIFSFKYLLVRAHVSINIHKIYVPYIISMSNLVINPSRSRVLCWLFWEQSLPKLFWLPPLFVDFKWVLYSTWTGNKTFLGLLKIAIVVFLLKFVRNLFRHLALALSFCVITSISPTNWFSDIILLCRIFLAYLNATMDKFLFNFSDKMPLWASRVFIFSSNKFSMQVFWI